MSLPDTNVLSELRKAGDGYQVDRWSFIPGAVALATVAVLALICQLPGTVSLVMIPLTLIGCVIGSIAVLAKTAFLVIKRRFRSGASIFLVLLLPILLWRPIAWGTELVHLGLTVGLGVGQIRVSSQSNGSEFAAYDWSVGLAGGPSTILIHDVTDEIALPVAQHKKPLSFEDGFADECAARVQHLVGHYYVCTI